MKKYSLKDIPSERKGEGIYNLHSKNFLYERDNKFYSPEIDFTMNSKRENILSLLEVWEDKNPKFFERFTEIIDIKYVDILKNKFIYTGDVDNFIKNNKNSWEFITEYGKRTPEKCLYNYVIGAMGECVMHVILESQGLKVHRNGSDKGFLDSDYKIKSEPDLLVEYPDGKSKKIDIKLRDFSTDYYISKYINYGGSEKENKVKENFMPIKENQIKKYKELNADVICANIKDGCVSFYQFNVNEYDEKFGFTEENKAKRFNNKETYLINNLNFEVHDLDFKYNLDGNYKSKDDLGIYQESKYLYIDYQSMTFQNIKINKHLSIDERNLITKKQDQKISFSL